jgi:hypothetical protein
MHGVPLTLIAKIICEPETAKMAIAPIPMLSTQFIHHEQGATKAHLTLVDEINFLKGNAYVPRTPRHCGLPEVNYEMVYLVVQVERPPSSQGKPQCKQFLSRNLLKIKAANSIAGSHRERTWVRRFVV